MSPVTNTNYIRASILIITYLVLISFASSNENISESKFSSIDSNFHLSVKSKIDPIPLNQIHQWVVHITNQNNEPVINATLTIDGGMPAHNHGLPTQPVATEIGQGNYLIEGVKFSMTGNWELWLFITTETLSDKVKITLQL